MATKKRACPRESNRLGNLVLPGKKEYGKILTELRRGVNPVDVTDDIFGPFYEIVGQIKRWKK